MGGRWGRCGQAGGRAGTEGCLNIIWVGFLFKQLIKSKLGRYLLYLRMKRTLLDRERGKAQFVLQINSSAYSRLYERYLQTEFHAVEQLIKAIVRRPFCREYYLKYPLEGLLKGICRKLLINVYELTLYGYFLSQVEWRLDHYIYNNLAEVFPNVIHVNEPTDPNTLKHLSMFLYFSSYSVKEFLNEDVSLIREQMLKLFPEFEHLQAHWTASQQTVGQVLNPKALNTFYRSVAAPASLEDYNTCVDRILQISPCYDISKTEKAIKELPSFGYALGTLQNYAFELHPDDLDIKIEDNLEDYKFDGDI